MRIVNNNELELEWKSTGTPKEGVGYYWVARSRVCGPTTTAKNFKEGTFWADAPTINVPREALMRITLSSFERNLIIQHVRTACAALPNSQPTEVLSTVLGTSNTVVTNSLFASLENDVLALVKAGWPASA
jgi:hypothetical protein